MKWPKRANKRKIYGCEKDSNTSRFSDILVFKRHCIYSSSNERNILTNRRYRKGVPSLSKIVYKITGYMKGCYWRSVFTISRFWPAPTTRVALPCHSWWNLLLLSWNLSSWALNTRHYILNIASLLFWLFDQYLCTWVFILTFLDPSVSKYILIAF